MGCTLIFPTPYPALEGVVPVRVEGELIGPGEIRLRAWIAGMLTLGGLACCDLKVHASVGRRDDGAELLTLSFHLGLTGHPGPTYTEERHRPLLEVCIAMLEAAEAGRHPLNLVEKDALELDRAGWLVLRDGGGAVVPEFAELN